MFTVCYNCGTRHTGTFAVCVSFAVCQEARHTANMGFAVCCVLLPCVAFSAHGKGYICRVPDIWNTAKLTAHGNQQVSGSGCCANRSPGLGAERMHGCCVQAAVS